MLRHLHILSALAMLILSVQSVSAQNCLNVVNPRFYYLPNAEMEQSGESIDFIEWRIETALPIELNNGTLIGFKPQYKTVSLKGKNSGFKDLHLHTIKVPMFAYWKFGESAWSMYADISPKLNSDFKSITSRHFQIGGMFIVYKERKKDFLWQFGVFYNQDTYGPFFMPLLGLDWKINSKDYFGALLPAYLVYEHRFSKKIYAGFELELSGETFRMGGSQYENSFISQVGENKLTFLTEPHLFLDYYLAKHFVLYLKPGMRLFHRYEHFTEDDQRVAQQEYIEGRIRDSFYIEAGIAFRFRYDEEKKTN